MFIVGGTIFPGEIENNKPFRYSPFYSKIITVWHFLCKLFPFRRVKLFPFHARAAKITQNYTFFFLQFIDIWNLYKSEIIIIVYNILLLYLVWTTKIYVIPVVMYIKWTLLSDLKGSSKFVGSSFAKHTVEHTYYFGWKQFCSRRQALSRLWKTSVNINGLLCITKTRIVYIYSQNIYELNGKIRVQIHKVAQSEIKACHRVHRKKLLLNWIMLLFWHGL